MRSTVSGSKPMSLSAMSRCVNGVALAWLLMKALPMKSRAASTGMPGAVTKEPLSSRVFITFRNLCVAWK